MVQLSRLLLSVSLVVASLATPLKRTVHKVEADVNQKIGPAVATLDNDVNGFPRSGLAGFLTIHTDINSLIFTLNTGTTDVKTTGPLSKLDATTILDEVTGIEPTILDSLSEIGGKKDTFASVPGGTALILSDLSSLKTSTDAFCAALIAAAPADLKAKATTIQTHLDEVFNKAITVFS